MEKLYVLKEGENKTIETHKSSTEYKKGGKGNRMEDTHTNSTGRLKLKCVIRNNNMSRQTVSWKGTTARLDFQKPCLLKHKNIKNLSIRQRKSFLTVGYPFMSSTSLG